MRTYSLTPVQQRWLNFWIGLINLALGVAFETLSLTTSTATYPAFEFYANYGPNQNQPSISMYGQSSFNVAPIGPVGFFVFAITRLGLFYYDRKVYQDMMQKGHNYVRWLEYALVGGSTLFVNVTILGVTEWLAASALVMMYIASTGFWLVHENYSDGLKYNKAPASPIRNLRGQTNWVAFVLSSSIQLVLFSILVRYFYLSVNTVPPFVLAEIVFGMIFHLLTPIWLFLDYANKVTDYVHVELGFLALLESYLIVTECILMSGFRVMSGFHVLTASA